MEKITRTINLNKDLISLIPPNTFFFDIETLGLSPRSAPIYLIGVLDVKEGSPKITLFFANHINEEEILLREFYEYIKDFNSLITFNGDRFDIPFVSARGENHNIHFDFSRFKTTDIYRIMCPVKKLLDLKSISQKSLERYLGIYREDEYDGGTLINVYKQYDTSQNQELKKLLILHNFEDVEGMAYLLPLIAYRDLLSHRFSISDIDYSDIENIIFKYNLDLTIPKSIRILGDGYHILARENEIAGTINPRFLNLKFFHKKTSDYVYLPYEGMIVPKILASSIPKERKQKPTKEQCYSQDEGYFFSLPSDEKFKSIFNLSDKHLFKTEYSDNTSYIKICGKEKSPSYEELKNLIEAILYWTFS